MASDKHIEHEGIVRKIAGSQMTVEILSKAACSGCAARSLCSSSEQKTKEIETEIGKNEHYEVGESVTVVGTESMGITAVVLCYAVPVVLMVITMAILTSAGKSDIIVGLSALGILVPYYAVIYMLKDRFKKKFRFIIKR